MQNTLLLVSHINRESCWCRHNILHAALFALRKRTFVIVMTWGSYKTKSILCSQYNIYTQFNVSRFSCKQYTDILVQNSCRASNSLFLGVQLPTKTNTMTTNTMTTSKSNKWCCPCWLILFLQCKYRCLRFIFYIVISIRICFLLCLFPFLYRLSQFAFVSFLAGAAATTGTIIWP